MLPKTIAKSHISNCKVGLGDRKKQFTNYSPIKEADDEGRQLEESKTSGSLSKSKTPVKDDDTDSSYTTESISHHQSSSKSKKKSGKKSHYTETESSMSMSAEPNSKAMAAQL